MQIYWATWQSFPQVFLQAVRAMQDHLTVFALRTGTQEMQPISYQLTWKDVKTNNQWEGWMSHKWPITNMELSILIMSTFQPRRYLFFLESLPWVWQIFGRLATGNTWLAWGPRPWWCRWSWTFCCWQALFWKVSKLLLSLRGNFNLMVFLPTKLVSLGQSFTLVLFFQKITRTVL